MDLFNTWSNTSFVTKSYFYEDQMFILQKSTTYPFESIKERLYYVCISFIRGFGRQWGKEGRWPGIKSISNRQVRKSWCLVLRVCQEPASVSLTFCDDYSWLSAWHTWEEGASVEELPPSDRPEGHFLDYCWYRKAQPTRTVPASEQTAQSEPAGKSTPLWFLLHTPSLSFQPWLPLVTWKCKIN